MISWQFTFLLVKPDIFGPYITNAAKVVDIIIWPNIVYQSRVQCAVESHFQLPWQKLKLGHAIEVPYMREKFTLLVSSGRSTGPSSSKFNPSKWPCCGVY
ncbi:hypothetical protein A2U01_0033477, partial [Trifolium medium]|nr:hypothetical protein [Trifolium medium]